MKRKIFIGVAWPYVNDVFHIGHLAGAYLPPDIFARYHRLAGNDVLMVSGSDCHGTPILLKAESEGVAPEEIAKKYHELNKKYLSKASLSYDIYTTTTTPNHRRCVQEMFNKLKENGYIVKKTTEQWYSNKSKRFLQDRYIEGTCPFCSASGARGDQCEKCGRSLDSLSLIDPVSKTDGSKLVKKKTENYFLDLGQLSAEVKKWLDKQKDMREWSRQEALGWIKEGLEPRAITRDTSYGVPLPSGEMEGKSFYVWFEAVIGYLSASQEYSKKIKKQDYFKEFSYKVETYYFFGQDNVVFHLINWPAQLLAYNKKINLPTNVLANKFLLLEGQKMSKSRNWVITAPYILDKYPVDALRFYLSWNMPEEKQMDFVWRDFIKTNNSILVGTIGNLIHRVFSLAKGGEYTVTPHTPVIKKVGQLIEKGHFRLAIREAVELASAGNRLVDDYQLWKLVKEDPVKAKKAFTEILGIIDTLRVILAPFLPESMEELAKVTKRPITRWEEKRGKMTIPRSAKPLLTKIPEEKIKEETDKLSS